MREKGNEMKIVQRIWIKGTNGNCADKAYTFVSQVLKRRYGNGVTFALAEETEAIIKQLSEAGYEAKFDGFQWPIMEPSDYEPGKEVILVNDFAMKVPIKVLEVKRDEKHGLIARVKYSDRPRKRAFWIKAQTEESFQREVKEAIYR